MGILESKFTLEQGIMTLKHISYGNKVWMPVNHEKNISGHDEHDEHDEHDDEHDDEKDTYIRRSLRLTLEQDIYHIQRTL